MGSEKGRRLLYVANARLPTEKAHGWQMVKSCQAFAGLVDVTLVHPWRRQDNPLLQSVSVWQYYDVPQTFSVVELAVPDLLWPFLSPGLQFPLFVAQSFIFAGRAMRLARRRVFDVVYTRDVYTALFLSFTSAPYVYEAHDLFETVLGRLWQGRICRRARGVVTNTDFLRRYFIGRFSLLRTRVLTARNGVDLAVVGSFGGDLSSVRRALGIPQDARVVVYTGHLFAWKGVYVLLDCMAALPAGYHLVLVGGMPADVERVRGYVASRGLGNVHVVGHVPPAELDRYRQIADVLVVPNLPDRYSTHLTCPIKVFEYMAAGRPIVASDLPSIREVLRDGEDGLLVPPDDPPALAEGIRRAVEERDLQARLVANAARKVSQFSWQQRARSVLRFVFPEDGF